MRRNDVKLGETYLATVSGKRTIVRIVAESPYGGWEAVNTGTGKKVRIKTAGRLKEMTMVRKGRNKQDGTKKAKDGAVVTIATERAMDPDARAEAVDSIEAGAAPEERAEAVEALAATPAPESEAGEIVVIKPYEGPIRIIPNDRAGEAAPEAHAAAEKVDAEPAGTEDAVALLRALGFERTGKEAEEVRYGDLVAAAKGWRDADTDENRRSAESTLARAGWFRAPGGEPKVVHQYEVLGTDQGLALRPMPVDGENAPTTAARMPDAPDGTAAPATGTATPTAPAASIEALRLGMERARAQVTAAEEEAKRMVATAKTAAQVATAAYRDGCKAAGKAPTVDARTRSANVSEKVSFEVALEGEHIRIVLKGKPETEEKIPVETVRAALTKTAYGYTDRHIGPKEVVGNKGGTLTNKLRAVLATVPAPAAAPASTDSAKAAE